MIKETAFTHIMGHLDVISFIGDSFSVYLPLCICILCLSTFFRFGSKLLHTLGFEQFILTDEMTGDLIREGQELVKRQKNKMIRHIETSDTRVRKPMPIIGETQPLAANHINRNSSEDNVRQELLNDVEPTDYSTNFYYHSTGRPQKDLFDDI